MSNGMKDRQSLYGALSSCCLEWRIDVQTDRQLQASADFLFDEGYTGFRGHFPDNPILPAIVQLAAVRYLCERALGRDLSPQKYDKIKFKGIIRPNDRLVVAVDLSGGETGWHGTFSLTQEDAEVAATGIVAFHL